MEWKVEGHPSTDIADTKASAFSNATWDYVSQVW
jgi:hypothetical protein